MRSPLAIIEVGHAPRGIAFSPDGDTAYVLNEHQLSVSRIDLTPFFSLTPMADGRTVFSTSSDADAGMSMPSGAFARSPEDMEAPNPAFMAGSDPTPDSPRVRPFRLHADRAVAYGVDPLPAAVRSGARIFTFARNDRMSHAGEFACATCHFEGGEDKLVWFISEGPRQTPALSGRLAGTAPFNWGGTKDGLEDNMVQTIDRMGGKGLTKSELADLEQFLLFGLQAPKNPNVAPDGELTPDQVAGKVIFESKEAGCASCHKPESSFTDGLIHDVGTASKVELTRFEIDHAVDPTVTESWRLNTPTLKGLFYTAPYLHDGSARTLNEVLERTAETMGKTSHLSDIEKEQLIAYLLTL
jgi:cytochrome c peroxidase